MKIQTKSKVNKRRACYILLAVATIVCMCIFFYKYQYPHGYSDQQKTSNKGNVNSKQTSSDQADASSDIKRAYVNREYDKNNKSNEDTTFNVSINFSSVSQTDNSLVLRIMLSGVESDKGLCSLKLTRNSSIITKSAGIQSTGSYTVCEGFDIPLSDTGRGVEWTAKATYSGPSGETATTERQVVIKNE